MVGDCSAIPDWPACGVMIEDQVPWLAAASRRKRWLVGVSGGADSVALLHMLHGAGFRDLVVCHLDHRLRGCESTGDARFVAALAKRLGYVAEIGKADVAALMKENPASMETAARHARHEFFARCARKYRCKRLLLAHHADDQAETVLWNLLRGSHGLKGMRERRAILTAAGAELEVHRPLLGTRHAGLVGWLEERRLRWREDAGNAEPLAVRNRLRNEALPLLSEISGRDAVAAFARGASDAVDQAAVVEWALERAGVMDPQGRLHLPVLRGLPRALRQAAVARYLEAAGVGGLSRELLSRVLEMLDPAGPPAVNLPGGGSIRRRAGRLFVAH